MAEPVIKPYKIFVSSGIPLSSRAKLRCDFKTEPYIERMAQRTVDPAKIKTLADWTARLATATNIGFDPETREPTIYDRSKERIKVSSIPWRREVDTITVLTQPTRFSAATVTAATTRNTTIQEQRAKTRRAGEEQLRDAEATLLSAWRSYKAVAPESRGTLIHEVLAAEMAVRDIERNMADKGRMIVELTTGTKPYGGKSVYVPPIPSTRRGLTVEDTAA